MPTDLYKKKKPRDKGYSFEDGKLKLGGQDQSYGPQPSPVEKAGLVPKATKKRDELAQKPEMDPDTGEIKLNGANQPQQPAGAGPVNDKGQIDFSTDPKAAQQALIDEGYLKPGGADGKWGKGSTKALNDYYRDKGIVPPNAEKLDNVLKDLGVNVNSYAGLSEKELKNHPRGNKSLTIDGKPVEFKTSEVSSGGEVSPGLVEAAEQVLPDLKDFGLKVTGGNDAYHLSDQYYGRRMKNDFKKGGWKKKRIDKVKGYTGGTPTVEQLKKFKSIAGKSKHTTGKNMDFVVNDPAAAREKVIAQGFELHKGNPPKYVNPKTGVTILDEYAGKTGGGTSPHFHMEGVPDGFHK